jgi:hypothetical protein
LLDYRKRTEETAMKKNVVRIILDVIMLALLLLMYDSNAISLSFHEIGGIALLVLFIAHKALNLKWIAASACKLFSRDMPGRARLKFIVDALMLVSIALVAVSGVLISEIVFPGAQGGGIWRALHYFASAVSLMLLGVHIGLNWSFVKRMIKLPRAVALPIVAVLLAAILGFGGYSLVTSSFSGWLASPFTGTVAGHGFGGGRGSQFGSGDGKFTLPENGELPDPGEFTPPENGELPDSEQFTPPQSREGYAWQAGGRGNGQGSGHGLGRGREASGGALGTIATYGSIAGVVAVITAALDKLIRRRRKQKNISAGVEPQQTE